MTTISRLRTTFTGFPGGPGVNTLYSTNIATIAANYRTFWDAIKAALPPSVSIQVAGGGDLLDDVTGVLTGAWASATPAVVVGTGTGTYAAPAGACCNWLTNSIADGHRVKGRTYIVPMASTAFQSDGTVAAATITSIKNAADTFQIAEAGGLCVWHRPRLARPADGSRKAVTARDGSHLLVTSTFVPDKVVVLRSRRD